MRIINYCVGNNGFSLIEVVFSVGLISISMLALSSLISTSLKENKAIEQKVAMLDTQNQIISLISQKNECSRILGVASTAINVSTPSDISVATLNLDEIKVSHSAANYIVSKDKPLPGFNNNELKVKNVTLKNLIQLDGANHFSGDLEIDFFNDTLVRSYKPIVIKNINFKVKPSPDLANAVIDGCEAPESVPSGICVADAIKHDPRLLHDGVKFKCCYYRPNRKVRINATYSHGPSVTRIVSVNWITQTIKANAYFSYCRRCASNYSGGELFYDSMCASDRFQVGYSIGGDGVILEPWRSGPVVSTASGSCGQNATVTAEVVNEFPGEPIGAPLNYMFCDDL